MELDDPFDFFIEERDPVGGLGIGRHHFQGVAPHPKGALTQLEIVAFVLALYQPPQNGVAAVTLAAAQGQHDATVGLGAADPVNARDRGHHHHVAPGNDRGRRREPQPLDFLVDVGFLFDVQVVARNIGLGLVVVVVGHEVLDRVAGEEFLELGVELGCQGLVVSHHQGGALDPGDQVGDGESLPGAGGAEKHLVFVAASQPGHQRFDRFRLVAHRLVGGVQFERGHGKEDSNIGGSGPCPWGGLELLVDRS